MWIGGKASYKGTSMIIIAIVALIVLVYFGGLNMLYCTIGLLAVLYACAIISARNAPSGHDLKRNHKTPSTKGSSPK
jgi:hypothetical protein